MMWWQALKDMLIVQGVGCLWSWTRNVCPWAYGCPYFAQWTLNSSEEVCRLCLCQLPMCQIYLSKRHGIGGRLMIDQVKSTCPNLIHFNYKSTAQSPCSNIPAICSLFPAGSPAVWTYSIHSHFCMCHWLSSIAHFLMCMELSRTEKDGMKQVWGTCFNQCKSYVLRKKRHNPLAISEAHQFRPLIR